MSDTPAPVPTLPSWDDLCGRRVLMAIDTTVRHPFDPDASGVALDLGEFTVFIFEDPSDGYRSSAAAPLVARESLYVFQKSGIQYLRAPVLIRLWTKSEYGGNAEGLEFIDERNGKTILLVGTSNSDDYYPSFVCDWLPQNLSENAEGRA